MRLYISADIEGIAAVVSREHQSPEGFEYDQARNWMTDAVLAACEAAHAEGVGEVVVSDSHGNMQNLKLDRLPPWVRVVRGRPRPLAMMQGIEVGEYAAAMFIGYHAGSTAPEGILAHTMRGAVVREVRLNGRAVPEAGVNAAIAGHFGVPVIMASGDDACLAEIRALLGDIECAEVKRAYSLMSALCLTPAAEQALIREKATAALRRLADFRPFRIAPPITLDLDFKHRLPAEILGMQRFVERTGAHGVRYVAADITDAQRFLVLALGYNPQLV